MHTESTASSLGASRRGWAARWLGAPAPSARLPERPIEALASQLIHDGRYGFLLLKEAAETLSMAAAQAAWKALESQMALVPAGVVPVVQANGDIEPMAVAAFYLDRYAVTNAQYACFVQAGCYDQFEIWPREIWPGLMRFVDRTGRPGPRFWANGAFPPELADHPVVGISWFEAFAYARWVGKRLPAAAEWQKAAGWPEHLSGGSCTRYPWGDVFAQGRANLFSSGLGQTSPVHAFPNGATPNHIYQMSGNVWEWLDDPLEQILCQPDEAFATWKPLRRIVGGAFDTYLPAEASNHFITGQPETDRRANIGVRCAVSLDRLRGLPDAGSPPA